MNEPIYMIYTSFFFSTAYSFVSSSESPLICPLDRYWDNVAGICKECVRIMSGFNHLNCSIPCRFPSYSFECRNKCNCSDQICSNILGCNMNYVRRRKQELGEKVCNVGYHGLDCLKPCRYPNFGPLCQNKCDCNETIRSNVRGCILDISTKFVTEVKHIGKELENSSVDSLTDSSGDINIGILTTIITASLLVIIVVTQLIRKQCGRRTPSFETNYNTYHI
ncbi:cell death abnormality protein 1-like [Crassostrea angulata]|uniref:cell death abnormality protein 1-like n=1 Tax=Magallana angulata TaxID=2784310 RepID=UPI0022B0BFE2|nr:cell death abnormality protein 1-like [Crassostrea angulata]